MPGDDHHAADARIVVCAIVTISDTRTAETDTSGGRARALLEAAGHRVISYSIVPDDTSLVRARLEELLALPSLEVIVTNGGTGLARRDTTFEAITALLEKRLDGFGELFRMLSWEQVGAAAMLSRATAGVARGKIVVSLPGSTAAVELGLESSSCPCSATWSGSSEPERCGCTCASSPRFASTWARAASERLRAEPRSVRCGASWSSRSRSSPP
jgi:molybdenum cofactor biosynthesis protein B